MWHKLITRNALVKLPNLKYPPNTKYEGFVKQNMSY